jgi:YfiH family protein
MGFRSHDLGGGARALVAEELEDIGVVAAFTERSGGASDAPFDTLNASFSVGDDPDAVRANRRHVIEALGVPEFALAGLVHGGTIARVVAADAGRGFESPDRVVHASDGLTTDVAGLPLAVTTADCVPVILAGRSDPTVTVVHAGWRGMAAGILAAATGPFAHPDEVLAAIGPAVGPDHYEVGEDVARSVSSGCGVEARTSRRSGRLELDLAATAAAALEAAGVQLVLRAETCTACEPDRFFSHRGGGPATGRQLAIVARLPKR